MSNDNSINSDILKSRTKKLAIEIVKLIDLLPRSTAGFVIGKQLCKSGTSVAANYRAACRARSSAEFFSKICICVEEADETVFWLEIIEDTNLVSIDKFEFVKKESFEILSILASTRKSLKQKQIK